MKRFLGRHRKRILITGCGRSGTVYIADLLTKMGLPIGHEVMYKFGTAAWQLAVDSEISVPYRNIRRRDYNFTIILHQVRHPLDVISSTRTFLNDSWDYIKKYIPVKDEDPLILKCMKYWYYWNLEAGKISQWTYRIEELLNVFDIFCEKIKHPELLQKKHIFNEVNKNINTRKDKFERVTWEELDKTDRGLCSKIKKLAEKYGYKI